MLYADIIIDINHEALDRPFQYIIPKDLENKVHIGSVVKVPFGKGNTEKKGYVIFISNESKLPKDKLKEILIIDEKNVSIEDKLISLAYWMSRRYGATFSSCLKSVLPVSTKSKLPEKKIVSLHSVEKAKEYLEEIKKKKNYSRLKERVINELLIESSLPWEVITSKLNVSSSIIRDLEKRKIVSVESTSIDYLSSKKLEIQKDKLTLNDEQQVALDTFVTDWNNGVRGHYLVYGVTGSGKTEVYIRMIEKVIEDGKDAIVLIPEIALTYQTLMRFYHRFGDLVSVMNSRLSKSEKYDIYKRAKNGEIRIVIGPRSALFSPLKNLGIIVIDEEHELSYKSEKMPRYHARDCAKKLSEITNSSLVLGSATPSLESFYKVNKNEIKLLKLTKRTKNAKPPHCEIVDLRNELKSGNRSMISRRLKELMEKNLQDKKQTILFLNRRGLISSVSCRECGKVIKCPHCDVSLSLHRDGKMYCHYCGYNTKKPTTCPSCNSKYIGGFKAGTQKTEDEVQKIFPNARILRMDADSTKGKDGHEKILSAFANKDADILIGTQMIVKGHDFPEVTLVGILAADLSLNVNDYSAAEKTFDLITQAAGRAGRDEFLGNVIIQTYRPTHYAVECAARADYEDFYNKEIAYRKILDYPPVGHMLLVMLLSRDESYLDNKSNKLYDELKNIDFNAWMSNISLPAVSKIADIYRRMIYFKFSDEECVNRIREKIDELTCEDNKITVYYDLDPINM